MNISRDIKPVTYLKSRASDLLKQINETHRPVVITQNGEPRAVLQDPESYEKMRNAIGLLKLISLGEKDIKDGKSKSQEEVFAKGRKMGVRKMGVTHVFFFSDFLKSIAGNASDKLTDDIKEATKNRVIENVKQLRSNFKWNKSPDNNPIQRMR
jgi:prevent-host-death family protein